MKNIYRLFAERFCSPMGGRSINLVRVVSGCLWFLGLLLAIETQAVTKTPVANNNGSAGHTTMLSGVSSATIEPCNTAMPGVLVEWNFASDVVQCNGAVQNPSKYQLVPSLKTGLTYCPNVNSGCGQGLLGSNGHANTNRFANGLCLLGFYDNPDSRSRGGCTYDETSTVWNPELCINLLVNYKIPAGKTACLSSFSLRILQKQFQGVVNFEKQGVAVKRNGVLIYSQTQNILASHINATPMTFNFSGGEFCTDGDGEVTYTIIFGLVHKLVPGISGATNTGYDDVVVSGSCGAPQITASVTPATCGTAGPLSNGIITLGNFGATNRYDYTIGTSYTGTQTYATATAILANGVIANNLPGPATPQPYTVRVFDATGCGTDLTVTLNPTSCPGLCTQPTNVSLAAIAATCSGTVANTNAQIPISGVTSGDRVGISVGTSYTGVAYAAATALSGGGFTFTGLSNPTGSRWYTIRVFNGGNTCYIDKTIELQEAQCSPCRAACAEIISSGATDPDSEPGNGVIAEDDRVCYEICKDTRRIDLSLTKTVTPLSGATCPTNTNFTWQVVIRNAGDMAATDIKVVDELPEALTLISSTASIGTFGLVSGWHIGTLAAGQSATLTMVTQALLSGTFTNCAEIFTAFPQNDLDSTPGNGVTTEDDYACAAITVTGSSSPMVEKGFSPMLTRPNTPTRLTLKITNNESTPITLTAPLVDNFPSSPGQMTIAPTPNLVTSMPGVIALAGDTKITVPAGTVLLPGLNQIQLDIIVPSNGEYCNTIAPGELQTTACPNLIGTKACLIANSSYVMAPIIRKVVSPVTVGVNTNSILLLEVENRNATSMTLTSAFNDYLPAGLVVGGSPTSTCGTVTAPIGGTLITLVNGSVIPPGSCTISVPVRSATAGTYCNVIPMNALLVKVGNTTNVGNEDIAEACLTVTSTPCTVVSGASIAATPSGVITPGSVLTLTASATGTGTSTIYSWTANGGSFSNRGSNPTSWTAPTAGSVYTFSVLVDNNATGYGSCTATATRSVTVMAPVCSLIATATPGTCNTATNQYTVSGTFSLTNNTGGGTASITDGAISTTVAVAASATSVAYSLTGLTSGTGSHTVTVSLPGCGTATAVYAAPASCTVAPPALAVVVGTPVCNTATNNYTATGTVSLTNAPAGSLTITDNGTTVAVVSVTAGQTSASFSVSGISGSSPAAHTVVASLPTTTASTTYATPASCTVCSLSLTTSALANGQVNSAYSQTLTTSGATAPATFTVSAGSLPAGLVLNASTGVISGVPTSATTTSFTVKVTDSKNCTAVAPLTITTSALPVCSLIATATPGACNTATNQYTVTGTVSATNAGVNSPQSLTISVGVVNTVVTLTNNGPVSYTLSGLTSDGLTKTVSVVSSASACGMASVTYAAPASCSVAPPALAVVVGTPVCNTATNNYTTTAIVSLTNATAGTLSLNDQGNVVGTISVTAGQTSATFTLTGVSGSTPPVHSVVANLNGVTASTTYATPASCTVCSLSLTTSMLTNGQVGVAYSQTLTTANGTAPLSFTVSAGSLQAGLALNGSTGVISGTPTASSTASFTVKVTDAKNCSAIAPLTITTSALPVCSLIATAAPGVCNTATNQYTVTGTVSATNAPATQSLTISVGAVNTVVTLTNNGPVSYTLTGLSSDGLTKMVSVVSSASACGTASVTYTAPASCTVAPPALAVVVGTPICNTATNNYTTTATVSLTNATAGTLTLTDQGNTVGTVSVTAGQTSATFTLTGVSGSSPASRLVVATLNGLTASTTYATPASCTVCSLSLTTSMLANGQIGSAYSQTLSISGGTTPLNYTISSGSLPTGLSLNPTTGVISGTPTAPAGTASFTVKVTDAKNCTALAPLTITTSSNPVCSLIATATPTICNSATNQYIVTGTVSATNAPATQSLTISVGSVNTVVSLANNGPVSYTLAGLTSDGATHTVSVISSASACGMASVNYAAPASCTVAPVTPTLNLDKLVSKSKAKLGEVISYTVVLVNSGSTSATSVVVSDTFSAGLSILPGSVSVSAGSFTPGLQGGQWAIASLPANATATLIYSASITAEGVVYNTATIPGDEASVCTSVPFKVCKGTAFAVELNAPTGYSRYQWYRTAPGSITSTVVSDGTLNTFTATQAGEYKVVVDSGINGACPNLSCCPIIIEEVEVPLYTALVDNPTCLGTTPQANGQLKLINLGVDPTEYFYQVSPGSSFTTVGALPSSPTPVPADGVISTNLAAGTYTVRVWLLIDGQPACPRDVVVVVPPANCACPEEICVPVTIRKTKSVVKSQ